MSSLSCQAGRFSIRGCLPALPRGVEAQYQAAGHSEKEGPTKREALAGQGFLQSHAIGGELKEAAKKR